MFVFGWQPVFPVAQNCRSHSFFPERRSKQRTCNRVCSTPLHAVTYTRPDAITGLDNPRPGRSAFQRMFSLSVHVVGIPVSSATPDAPLPRNCLQSPADAAGAPPLKITSAAATHMTARSLSFPRSAWERTPGRSASRLLMHLTQRVGTADLARFVGTMHSRY